VVAIYIDTYTCWWHDTKVFFVYLHTPNEVFRNSLCQLLAV
jgi:hypothetical protein